MKAGAPAVTVVTHHAKFKEVDGKTRLVSWPEPSRFLMSK
jgi:hypothetical protein